MSGGGSFAGLRYLKAVWYVSQGDCEVTVSRVADRLAVSQASASAALRRLLNQGLLERDSMGRFELTPSGQEQALRLVRRHRLLETFLSQVLGLPWDLLHDEAEQLEWHVSDLLEARIAAALGHPARDPHGDPIPPTSGEHIELVGVPLATVPAGATATIVRVADDADLLRYLAIEGLSIGSVVTVGRREPYGGPLWLTSAEGRHALGPPAVGAISVTNVVTTSDG